MNNCKNCIWGTYHPPNKVLCMFPSCFNDKEVKLVITNRKTPPYKTSDIIGGVNLKDIIGEIKMKKGV